MAATVNILEKNGPGETETTKTSSTIRFKDADDANINLLNPIVRPASLSVWSYEKALRLNIVSPPTGSITSPRAFSDNVNGFGTGVTMMAGTSVSYVQPADGSAASSIATVDFFSYTSGAPLSIGGGSYSSVGDIAEYLYLQAEVASTASPGLTPTETLTIAFDET